MKSKWRWLCLIACMLSSMSFGARASELRPFVDGSWASIVKAHAERPTIIHFWGVSCRPCRTEMPIWGQIIKQRHGFDFVTVETDMAPGPSEQIEAFLSNAGLPPSAEAWRFADGFAEKLYFQVDPKWQGEIPMTIFIGKDGHIERHVGVVDSKAADKWLDAQNVAH